MSIEKIVDSIIEKASEVFSEDEMNKMADDGLSMMDMSVLTGERVEEMSKE